MKNASNEEDEQPFRLNADGKVFVRRRKVYPNEDVYDGECVDGLRHGEGTMKFHNGDRYDGEFVRDQFHGYGIFIWSVYVTADNEVVPGKRYEGFWSNGRFNGKGFYTFNNGDVYTGMFKNGFYEGKGTLKLTTGDLYQGEWIRGMPGGLMRVKYANGDEYQGSFSVGKYHGKGKYSYRRGLGWYDGEWFLGSHHGKGTRLFSNGSQYTGDFLDGELHGEGMMRFVTGDQYLGEWRCGHIEGKGVYKYCHGGSYEGSFLKGFPYGEGKYTYPDGGYYKGEFRNQLHVNKYKAALMDGVLNTIPQCDGLRHGFGLRVWTSGVRYEGQWHEDKLHGFGTITDRLGASYKGQFSNGLRGGEGREEFGNTIGVEFTCPLGYKHSGAGYCNYTGNYTIGCFHGYGEFTCQAGPCYKGQWRKGKKNGKGEMRYMKEGEMGDSERLFIGGVGSLYRTLSYNGSWEDDIKQGHGVLTYTNNDTIEGMFRQGQPHGIMRYTFHSINNKTKKYQPRASTSISKAKDGSVTIDSKRMGSPSGGKIKKSDNVSYRYVRFEYGCRMEWLDDEDGTISKKLSLMWRESDKKAKQ